jgi:hypothetical protein
MRKGMPVTRQTRVHERGPGSEVIGHGRLFAKPFGVMTTLFSNLIRRDGASGLRDHEGVDELITRDRQAACPQTEAGRMGRV